MITNTGKLYNILKYLVIYFLFVLFILLNKSQNNLYFVINILPNFDILLIFFIFVWFDKKQIISKYNLFLFGLIIDTFNFLPLCLTSLTLLLVYKIVKFLKTYFIQENYTIYFIRDNVIFMLLYFILQWFFLSFYENNFFSFKYVFISIIKNIVYSILIYLLYKKLTKNV